MKKIFYFGFIFLILLIPGLSLATLASDCWNQYDDTIETWCGPGPDAFAPQEEIDAYDECVDNTNEAGAAAQLCSCLAGSSSTADSLWEPLCGPGSFPPAFQIPRSDGNRRALWLFLP